MNGIQLTLARTQNKFASVTASIVVWLVVWRNFCSEKISSTTEHQHASVWELNLLMDTGVLRWNTDLCKKFMIYLFRFIPNKPENGIPAAVPVSNSETDGWVRRHGETETPMREHLPLLFAVRTEQKEREIRRISDRRKMRNMTKQYRYAAGRISPSHFTKEERENDTIQAHTLILGVHLT